MSVSRTWETRWWGIHFVLTVATLAVLSLLGARAETWSVGLAVVTGWLLHTVALWRPRRTSDPTQGPAAGRARVEDRYRLALEASQDGFWDCDLETGEVFTSPQIVELLGVPARDLTALEEAWQKLLHPADRAEAVARLEDLRAGRGRHHDVEYRLMAEDGTVRWVRARTEVSEVRSDGSAARLTGVISDITARKEQEERLRTLNSVLQSIRGINQLIKREKDEQQLIAGTVRILTSGKGFVHAWIALCAEDGRLDRFVAGGFKRPREELERHLHDGRRPRILQHAREEDGLLVADCPKLDWWLECDEEGIASMVFCLPLEHEADRFGYLCVSVPEMMAHDAVERSLFREVGEDLSFALAVARSRRERTEARAELIAAKERAEEANRAKDEFLALMSHEMRTPLNPIIGFTSILLEEVSDAEQRDYLETVLSASHRLLHLIDNLLAFVSLAPGATQPACRPFAPRALCREVLDNACAQAGRLALRLADAPAPLAAVEDDLQVRGDPEILRRVLGILLENACKYTPEGTITLTLGIESEPTEGPPIFVFAVEDTGHGIEPRLRERIFEPFMQVDSSYARAHEGAGLGLAIARKLVQILGGTIELSSEPSQGSRFTFRIPLEPAGKGPAEVVSAPEAWEVLRGRRILVVDDNLANAEVAETAFVRAGAQVRLAMSGPEALKTWEAEDPFDLVLMDLAMPGMDGLEVHRELQRRMSPERHVPVIAVSAHVTWEDRERSLAAGMVDHLGKPVSPRKLVEAAGRVLAGALRGG
ncbi:MAG: ATP-binding protein [Verrucomicrobiota bacterium]